MKEVLYTVKYKLPGQRLWTTVKNVRGDGIQFDVDREGATNMPLFKYLVKDDDTVIQFPLDTTVIFAPERAQAIERKMSREAKQPIQRL